MLDAARDHPVRAGSLARRASQAPLTARLSASVPPEVKTTSDGRAPSAAPIRSRASSTTARAARPGGVQRGRVADHGGLLHQRLERGRQHRGRRRVVEVGRHGRRVYVRGMPPAASAGTSGGWSGARRPTTSRARPAPATSDPDRHERPGAPLVAARDRVGRRRADRAGPLAVEPGDVSGAVDSPTRSPVRTAAAAPVSQRDAGDERRTAGRNTRCWPTRRSRRPERPHARPGEGGGPRPRRPSGRHGDHHAAAPCDG